MPNQRRAIRHNQEVQLRTIAIALLGSTLVACAPRGTESAPPRRASPAALERCANGDAEACWTASYHLRSRDTTPDGYARALRLADRACDLGDARGCKDLATAYSDGDYGAPRAPQRALHYLRILCNTHGDRSACTDGAIILRSSDEDSSDLDEKRYLESIELARRAGSPTLVFLAIESWLRSCLDRVSPSSPRGATARACFRVVDDHAPTALRLPVTEPDPRFDSTRPYLARICGVASEFLRLRNDHRQGADALEPPGVCAAAGLVGSAEQE